MIIDNNKITINLQLTKKKRIDTLNFLRVNYVINTDKKIKDKSQHVLTLSNLYNDENLTNEEKNKSKIYISNIDNNILK